MAAAVDTAVVTAITVAEATAIIAAVAIIAADAPALAADAVLGVVAEDAARVVIIPTIHLVVVLEERYRKQLSSGLACISRKQVNARTEKNVPFPTWCNYLGMSMQRGRLYDNPLSTTLLLNSITTVAAIAIRKHLSLPLPFGKIKALKYSRVARMAFGVCGTPLEDNFSNPSKAT